MRGAKVFVDAVKVLGIKSRLIKALEEFTELNMAILHKLDGRVNDANLLEEIIDAEIMLSQLKICYISQRPDGGQELLEEINAAYDDKVERLSHIVNKAAENAKTASTGGSMPGQD